MLTVWASFSFGKGRFEVINGLFPLCCRCAKKKGFESWLPEEEKRNVQQTCEAKYSSSSLYSARVSETYSTAVINISTRMCASHLYK